MNKETLFSIRADFLICLFFVLGILTVYWQVRHHEFVAFDDEVYLTQNSKVRAGLTPENLVWAFTTGYASNWHPLTWLSHMSDVQLYGMDPGRHHLTNVLFHMANTLLLFFVLRRMTNNLWPGAIAAALFALHPLHAESVAQVAERKDVLSTLFWMLTLWAYVRYAERPVLGRYLLVLVCFMLGLMAKPMVITLPCVLILLDYWPLNRFSSDTSGKNNLKNCLAEKIPFFILSGVSGAVTFLVQQNGGAVRSLETYPLHIRIGNALVAYVKYIGKMIWPSDLSFFYPHEGILPLWQILGAGILLLLVFLFVIRNIKQHPYLAAGWLWYMGTLVPVIGLVQVGSQSMADRYTYIPLIGIFIMIAYGIPDLLTLWPGKERLQTVSYKAGLAVVSTVLLSALMAMTYTQVRYWRNSITLLEHAIDVTKNNLPAHTNLGVLLLEQGKLKQGFRHLSEALRIRPDAVRHRNMGIALEKLGKSDQAKDHYTRALRLNPNYVNAHINMGLLLESQGNLTQAIRHHAEALRLDPGSAKAHHAMGVALFRQGRTDKAIAHFQKALQINPDDPESHNSLGVALFQKGKNEETVAHFKKALQIKPDYAEAHDNLRKVKKKLGINK
ncbi:tetratricopeptide repeat protein [Desulfonema magnum]|uniref:Glycosyltransferase domain-containing protein, tetratricopeptide repeat-containing n=1 Tax=Desulfonema magnum TaxID=45655 RepID=A0A975BWF9_9BACT|nr:tetratricopeptide repeat protein [Desulfonema magnum]QTA92395.1 Glycosyltransferase domain-containing protein, tetratricopeptide repeat-containing [Desulfonema magnum]